VAAICRSYASHAEALQAVNAVLGAGVEGSGVRVLAGAPARDAHTEPVGEFGGTTEPDAPVGSFAGGSHEQDAAAGAFAGGKQRGGTFADADREVVTSYPDGVEHMRVAGHRKIKELLTDAGLDEATAARDIDALHEGRVLVLVEIPEGDAARVQAALET
jgi:hypothetical protein